MIDRVLSDAIVRYTGQCESSSPGYDETHAVDGAPPEQHHELIAQITAIVGEMFAIQVDREGLGFLEGIGYATSFIRGSHPELDDDAIAALQWLYGFEMR